MRQEEENQLLSKKPIALWPRRLGRSCMWVTVACIVCFVSIEYYGDRGNTLGEVLRATQMFMARAAVISFSLTLIALRYWSWLAVLLGIVVLLVIIFVRTPRIVDDWSAVALLRDFINAAEVKYPSSNQGNYGTIPQLISRGLLDAHFEHPIHGYVFTATPTRDGYTAAAIPTSKGAGKYGYFSTADGVIRYSTFRSATCNPCFPQGLSGKPLDP
jgi:hypothetical protein